jgi:hypothetical protein
MCYTVLRQPAAVSAPAREQVTVPETYPVDLPDLALGTQDQLAAQTGDPLSAFLNDPLTAPLPGAGDETAVRGRHAGPDAADVARWPCPQCDAQVPISLDFCDSCGGAFLASAKSRPSTRLPVVGDVQRLSTGQRWAMIGVIGVSFMVVLVLLAALGGHIL